MYENNVNCDDFFLEKKCDCNDENKSQFFELKLKKKLNICPTPSIERTKELCILS